MIETDEGKINKVEDCLKSRNKIYDLPGSFSEMRVNDYNPVLLLLWKANLNIQFISENSLALAHYVTGYVTKAERRAIQLVNYAQKTLCLYPENSAKNSMISSKLLY